MSDEKDLIFDDLTPKGKDNNPKNTASSASGLSEVEQIRRLEEMETNFVFFFGKSTSGKSAILSSLLFFLRNDSNYGRTTVVSKFKGDEGPSLEASIQELMQEGRFLPRTRVDDITYLTVRFSPYKPDNAPNEQKYPTKEVTFLEMSGENLTEVAVQKNAQLPNNIDMFFRVQGLSLMFVLVVPWNWYKVKKDSTDKLSDDFLMAQFLDYLDGKNAQLRNNSRIVLLISKWDSKENREEPIMDYVEKHLPKTFGQIKDLKNVVEVYSVGNIIEADGEPYVQKINTYYPKQLWRQIYKTFAGHDLDFVPQKKPWWKFW